MKFYKDAKEGSPQFDLKGIVMLLTFGSITGNCCPYVQLPSKEIALGTYKYRTLGLGYANIGGL